MIGNILITLFFLLVPVGVLWLCDRVRWLGKVGPVLILYIIGIVAGNIFHPSGMAQIQDVLSSAMVPLAIPLMLFSCSFRRSETRSQLLALLTGIAAVVIAVIAGYLIFGRGIPDGEKVGGMLTGVYTGGTINLASLKSMLGASDETFILLNSYDMIISFLYLVFLMSVGIKLFRKFLPRETAASDETAGGEEDKGFLAPYKALLTREGLKDLGVLIAIDAVIIGISAGLGLLAGDNWFMVVLILMLTTLGIAGSFWRPVKTRKGGYDAGMYFIYVFSVVVASMADFSKMDLSAGLGMLGYLTFVIFGSLALQVLLAWLLRIDSDTMVISSVTYICSPPFVPMMSGVMKNKSILPAGLAIGVIGYAAGNYLGFLLSQLLALLG